MNLAGISTGRPRVPGTVKPDDSSLIELAASGSAHAVAELYERYWPLAWQWACLVTGSRTRADDLAQEAVLRAFTSLDRFDPERPFGPWLKRILVNKAIDDTRRDRRVRLGDEWMADLRTAPEETSVASDELVAAVRLLAPARRDVPRVAPEAHDRASRRAGRAGAALPPRRDSNMVPVA